MCSSEATEVITEDQSELIMPILADELAQCINAPEHPVVIEFYASWCIYHLLTKKKLERLRNSLGENVFVGSIDCIGHEELFHRLGIHQIPTIGYFHGETRLLWAGDTDLEIMLEQIQSITTQGERS